jgi:hypothetical protein
LLRELRCVRQILLFGDPLRRFHQTHVKVERENTKGEAFKKLDEYWLMRLIHMRGRLGQGQSVGMLYRVKCFWRDHFTPINKNLLLKLIV